jgi:hypothetical protein
MSAKAANPLLLLVFIGRNRNRLSKKLPERSQQQPRFTAAKNMNRRSRQPRRNARLYSGICRILPFCSGCHNLKFHHLRQSSTSSGVRIGKFVLRRPRLTHKTGTTTRPRAHGLFLAIATSRSLASPMWSAASCHLATPTTQSVPANYTVVSNPPALAREAREQAGNSALQFHSPISVFDGGASYASPFLTQPWDA